MTKAAKDGPEPGARVKDETPIVAVEFTSAALALLVRVLNDETEGSSLVEIQDLAAGRVRVVTTLPAEMSEASEAPTPADAPDVSGTVDDVGVRIGAAETVEQLDGLKKAEKAGKARTGVLEAIDKRKAEIKG